MARAARFVRRNDIEIVNKARANLEASRDPKTNAFNREALIAEVERLMPFDAVRERRQKAERIVRDQERPAKTESDGSLWLPGFERPYPYEPNQLIPDDLGKTVERDKATPHFVAVSLARKDEHRQRVEAAYKREKAYADAFTEWAADQAVEGRLAKEITFGNFVREKGYWNADLIEDEDGDDGDGD